MKEKIQYESTIKKIIYIIFILSAVSLLIFILHSYKNFGFNSDSAVRVILAKEIYESGNYFPKDWYFVNGDIWVFTAHTIIIPLLRYFPAGYSIYAFASLVMAVAILLSIKVLIDTLKIEKNNKIIILTLITSGISLAITENLFGQISYGLTIMYYCLLISSCIRMFSETHKLCNKNSVFVFILLVMIFWSNPLRGLVFFLAPLGLSLGYYLLQCYKQQGIVSGLSGIKHIIYTIILSIVVGVILNKITLNSIQMNSGVTQLQWVSLSEMTKRIPKIINSLLFILGGEPYANRSLFTISGIYDGFRLIVALCFIVLIPLTIKRILKLDGNNNIKIFTTFTCGAFLIIAFLMISTNIYNARYLLPAVVLMIFIVYIIPFNIKNNSLFDALRILTIIGFLTNTLVINTGYWETYRVSEAHKDDWQSFNDVSKLVQYVENNNLKYGYATFWNAGSVTVLSDNKVKVRQIYIENGIPQKFKWLSSNSWYEQSNEHTKTFLLLTKQEAKALNWKLLKDEFKLVPESEKNFEDYKIYIFNENISNNLINWIK